LGDRATCVSFSLDCFVFIRLYLSTSPKKYKDGDAALYFRGHISFILALLERILHQHKAHGAPDQSATLLFLSDDDTNNRSGLY